MIIHGRKKNAEEKVVANTTLSTRKYVMSSVLQLSSAVIFKALTNNLVIEVKESSLNTQIINYADIQK